MTDQHPLTNEVIHREFLPKCCYREDDLRAAADWQLKQVIDWLRHNLHLGPTGVDYVVENLREAMRPTTQEDN